MSAKVNVFFMRINSVWISGIAMMLFTACNVIEYHPYDTRITGDTDVNARNILRIENSMSGRKSIRFAMISDTQRRYDETEDVVNLITAVGILILFYTVGIWPISERPRSFFGQGM